MPLHACRWIQILTECKSSPLNTVAVASKLKAKQQAVLQDATTTTYETSNVLLLNKEFPGRLGIPRVMYIIYTSQAKGPGADPGVPSCPSLG